MKIITFKYLLFAILTLALGSCATKHAQYGKNAKNFLQTEHIPQDEVAHTFFLVGDAGNADEPHAQEILNQLKTSLDSASANSSLLFLGDNIYPKGLPKEDDPNRKLAEEKLDNQIALAKNFKGKTIFVPGNHDWYSNGIVGLKAQQDYVTQKLNDKNAFLPKNSCGIETKKIDKNISVIYLDSEWFLADWEKNPGINEKCDFKTREDFFTEFEDQLSKNQNKTIIVALHHPLEDHGSHGGKYSWEKQIFPLEGKIPLPILASFVNLARATGGITHQDLSNPNYRKYTSRLKTLLANRNNVIVVSGHDHNLQYIEKNGIRQIISGAGSKSEAATVISKDDFSYGKNGYATLKISKDGDAEVEFYGRKDNKTALLFRKQVLENAPYQVPEYPKSFPEKTTASIYEPSKTQKSNLYKWLFGNNYRQTYATPVEAKTLVIDTLFGGAKPTRAGGGHQTNSLRLDTPKGEYVLRALKKSGVRFLQSVAFKNQYVQDDFEDSFADNFLLDFFTSSNPYTPLAVGHLSEAIGLKFTNPELVYVPKQKGLGKFNQSFGNELYYLEVRPAETEENLNEVLSTEDIFKLLAKDEKYKMDEKSYIRARLFDMLIGDWDRHHDQWKWEQKQEGKNIYFSPIPKDRDQAFVRYDGWLTKMLLTNPALNHMQSFEKSIKNIKRFNMEPFPMDLAFTKNSTEEDWIAEAKFIAEHLTENTIDQAFNYLPKEVQNDDIQRIKNLLNVRKKDLQNYATEYFQVLQKHVLLTGTNKNEKFVITRLPNQQTEVKIYRVKKTGEELDFQKTYSKNLTKEIWIYGLADDDIFEVKGNENNPIKLRLLGGLNNDSYQVEKRNKVSIYDYKTKNNTFISNNLNKHLSDSYELNEYNYRIPKFNQWYLNPSLGYNPDDGLILGATTSFVKYGFKQNPFTNKHTIDAQYFTNSQGYALNYSGIFPKTTGNWFYQLDARYTSSQFIRNYFGNGNLTINDEKNLEEDFYRVRAKNLSILPSINWKKNSSLFTTQLVYEVLKIEKTDGRRISLPNVVDEHVFNSNQYLGANVGFHFENINRKANPSLGMKFDALFTYRQNLKDSDKKLPTFEAGLGFIHHITKNEKLVLSTYAKAKWLLSNDYEFYQMATLGGNDNLRGFRYDRFYGKNSFYQTSDLRLSLGKLNTGLVPLNIGIFGGFDYGRVWIPNEVTDKWHTSYGGGLWINALDQVALQTSYFFSSDSGRFVIGLGMNF